MKEFDSLFEFAFSLEYSTPIVDVVFSTDGTFMCYLEQVDNPNRNYYSACSESRFTKCLGSLSFVKINNLEYTVTFVDSMLHLEVI